MTKRIITLLLALLLALAPLNVALPASAAETDIESTVRSDFRDFVASQNPGEGVNDAVMEVFKHTIFGGGRDMNMGEGNAFIGLLLSANVAEDGLVAGITAGLEQVIAAGSNSLTAQGSLVWGETTKSYNFTSGSTTLASDADYTGSLNACDDAMVILAGNSDAGFTITRNPVTDDSISYKVTLKISSLFDISAVDASMAPNDQIKEGLTWVKRMQRLGLGGDPFKWVVTCDFDVSFPNSCSHNYGGWTNRDEDSHVRTCSDCGAQITAAHSWDAGVVSDDGASTTYTCAGCAATRTEYNLVGTWTTDLVFSAADFGVEAEDIRFRCTLTFDADGTVTADWTAVELTAIKLYFHQIFVNAYYACAYGAGYTDIEAIEAFCQESTGMSVSDYMMSFLDSFDMNAIFTPASASGTYEYRDGLLFWDLKLMELTSDPTVGNPCTLGGDTMTITTVSHGQPTTLTFTRVN